MSIDGINVGFDGDLVEMEVIDGPGVGERALLKVGLQEGNLVGLGEGKGVGNIDGFGVGIGVGKELGR